MIKFRCNFYVKGEIGQISSKMAYYSFALVFGRKYYVKEEKIQSAQHMTIITCAGCPFKTEQKPEFIMIENLEI